MCRDLKIEYCNKQSCDKYSECHAIFTKANDERNKINLSLTRKFSGYRVDMRVGKNSPLRQNKNFKYD